MSSKDSSPSTSNTEIVYPKRKLKIVPFNNQLEIIHKTSLNISRNQSNSNQFTNFYQSRYNNSHNNNNQAQQSKFALAAVAAAAAVQQQQQTYLLQQQAHQKAQQHVQQQAPLYATHHQLFHTINDNLSSTSLLPETIHPISQQPIDFKNNLLMLNDRKNTVSSPTIQSSNINLQQNKIFDSINKSDSKNLINSPMLFQSSPSRKSSPPNMFLSTSVSGAAPLNSASTTSSSTSMTSNNCLSSPPLLPNVTNNLSSSSWANPTSIWGSTKATSMSASSSTLDNNNSNNNSNSFGDSSMW